MHLRELDANLIVILDALLLEASVTKAAERLGRSPSAVSHALARLRAVFDDPLFVRAGQRLVPTSRATQLAPTVHIIVSGLEGLLHRDGGFAPHAQQRNFTIGCRSDLELTLLAAVRTQLGELAPAVTLERRCESDVVEALRAGRIALAVVEGAAETNANDISAERLFEEPFIALAPEANSAATLALTRADGPRVFAEAALAPHLFDHFDRPRPAPLETVASALVAVHAALANGGVALVPASVARIVQRHMRMRAVTTEPRLPSIGYHLLWHLSMERDVCHAWLRDRIRDCAGALCQEAPAARTPIAVA